MTENELETAILGFLDVDVVLEDSSLLAPAYRLFPNRVSLVDIRNALGRLAANGQVEEIKKGVWRRSAAEALASTLRVAGPVQPTPPSVVARLGTPRPTESSAQALPLSVAAVLQAILNRQTEVKPTDGPPLYQYQVTAPELHELREALRTERRGELALSRPSISYSAALCLFASHWICRHFSGGSWSWAVITNELGWNLEVPSLYPFIERGLRYFRREPIRVTGRTEYLMTMVCEGGLPLHLLRSEAHGRLRQFFRAALIDAEVRQEDASLAIARNLDLLPNALRNGTTALLSEKLLRAIVSLRNRGLPDGVEPVRWLDENAPRWRVDVPLHLEDDVAESFLTGLLRARRVAPHSVPFSVESVLSRDGTRLERRFNLPAEISRDALRSMFGDQEFPARLYLNGQSERGEAFPLATAIARPGTDSYKLYRHGTQAVTADADVLGNLRVIAIVAGQPPGVFDPPGGGALPADAPWVFEATGNGQAEATLVSVGSARIRAPEAVVLLPKGCELPHEGSDHLRRMDETAFSGREMVGITGTQSIRIGDDAFTIEVNAAQPASETYFLRGRHFFVPLSATTYYQGVPSVWETTEGRIPHPVASTSLSLRLAHGREWLPWSEKACGRLKLRLKKDGAVVFRRDVVVLPHGFDLRLVVKEGSGLVRLACTRVSQAKLVRRLTELVPERVGPQWEWRVEGPSLDPLTLVLTFEPGMEAELEIPSPISSSRFVGIDGRDAPVTPVRLDELSRIKAQVASPDCARRRYHIQAKALEGGPSILLADLPSTTETTKELNLLAVERLVGALLSRVDNLDATVRLTIEQLGGIVSPKRSILLVNRYDAEPSLQKVEDAEGDWVELKIEPPPEFSTIEARSFLALNDEAREFHQRAPGTWRIPCSDLGPGPWLFCGWVNDVLRMRPTLFTIPGAMTTPGTLAEAVGDPQQGSRASRIDAVLKRLAQNWDDPAWDELMDVVTFSTRVPAATFDVLKALPRHPAAAAIALLKSESSLRWIFWRKLEELSFLWPAIPLRAWYQAVDACSTHLDGIRRTTPKYLAAETARCQKELVHAADGAPAGIVPMLAFCAARVRHFAPLPGDEDLFGSRAVVRLRERLRALSLSLRQRHPHAEEFWPAEPVEFGASVDADLDLFKIRVERDFHRPVLEAPLRLAYANVTPSAPLSPLTMFQLRRLRAFDPEWFDEAHATFVTLLICRQLQDDSAWCPET